MTNRKPTLSLRHLGVLFGLGSVGTLSDSHLLDQFSSGHREAAEAAFATLVERHGPMVLRVSRGVLGDSHDVQDAFQATFLVLIRKADTLWVGDSLGPWLHGVALRVATKARVAAARRQTEERRVAEAAGSPLEPARRSGHGGVDDASTLHEEIDRLPAKYRSPIVLCYLEGLTHDSAAVALGWPVGTVRGRLSRARDLLRSRLIRRGLTPSAVALAVGLETAEGGMVTATATATLAESLVRSATSLIAERSAGVAPASVAALAEGGSRVIGLNSLRTAVVLATAGIAAIGLVRAYRPSAARPASIQAPVPVAAKPVQDSWPAGAEVTGRVVNHLGQAVAGAEVLLLGAERLLVSANLGDDGTPSDSLSTRPAELPPVAKTDAEGRFSVRHPGKAADRIAVVSPRLLLWTIPRRAFARGSDLEIQLPEPVALKLHSEIPDKPATQEFQVVGRVLDPVDRTGDSLYYRHLQVPNPGERAVPGLPPAQYAVERTGLIAMGTRGQLMMPSERRVETIEAGGTRDLRFDRKVGRAIEGRVQGLEGAKLRYAFVRISYFGPEESMEPGKPLTRMLTGFDAVAIAPDGRFTTPPLPPNRYEIRLSAMLAATPKEDSQSDDFSGEVTVNVPGSGPLPSIAIVAEPTNKAASGPDDPTKTRLEVRAVDESGASIRDFEVQLYGPPNPSPDAIGVEGVAVIGEFDMKRWKGGDLIVSAPGFASEIREFGRIEGPTKLEVRLKRGVEVRLRVRDQRGRPIPRSQMPLPQVYLTKDRRDAWSFLAMSSNEARATQVALANLIKVRPEPDGDFSFRVRPDQAEPLYFGFSHPDLLIGYETGPVAVAELIQGSWDIQLPEPATVEVALQSPDDPAGRSPFGRAYYSLSPIIPRQKDSVPLMSSGILQGPEWRATLGKLAPGGYNLSIQTVARGGSTPRRDLSARSGEFQDGRTLDLKPGPPKSVVFEAPRFDPEAWRGRQRIDLVIEPGGDRLVGGEEYRVWYGLANYGNLSVATGQLGADGRIRLEGLTPSGTSRIGGQYEVEVGGEPVGSFRVADNPERQEFRLKTPPRAGDLPASLRAIDLATDRAVEPDAFRGRVVFLEFWATWCGPCREPMESLVALGRLRGEAWRDDVSLVAIGTDNDREPLKRQVSDHGPTPVRFLWSPREGAEPSATANADFAITRIPTAFLIGKDGRIAWRGHPGSIDVAKKIEELRAQAR